MVTVYGCGPRADRIMRTGVTEPNLTVRSNRYRPIVAGPQAVTVTPPQGRALGRRAPQGKPGPLAQKIGNAIRTIAARFAKGQPVRMARGASSIVAHPGKPTPGGIAGQLVAAAKAVVAGRPVVVKTPSGIDRIMPGRAARWGRTGTTPGFSRSRGAATAAAGTRAVMQVDARMQPDRLGARVKSGVITAMQRGAATQARRQAPPAFGKSAYASPYTSIYGKR